MLLLAKIKLAVLEGDLRRSLGDVGECRLRREPGLPADLAAVRRRIASCKFIEGDAEAAGGDLVVRDDAGGTTRGSGLAADGCVIVMAGGEAGEGELIIRDFLMGFWGASELEDEAGVLFLITTSVSGCSCSCGASEPLLTDGGSAVCRREGGTEGGDSSSVTVAGGPCGVWSSVLADSSFMLERSCAGEAGRKGMSTGAEGPSSTGGGFSGLVWLELSVGVEMVNSWAAGRSVFASSGWWGSSVGGGGGGIL